MAEEIQNQEQLEEQIGDSLTKIEKFIEDNKKVVVATIAVVVVLICGFFAYKNLYLDKQQDKALAAMFQAENQFRADSFHIALYGNENVTGFVDVIDEYGNTSAGNTACYYAGICAMRLGEFEDAIKYLEDFSTNDPIVGPESIALLGDAYAELEDYKKAASKYEKAAKKADSELLSPIFLMKAGKAYEKIGDNGSAVKAYTKIKEDYNNSPEAASIEKYITRAQLKK
ncbi:MAG: tetratricopeptide repeat protein [Bacteroidales bacterium]|nr:tetratricopeptide repeat protein [Bacteroidales bacterium]